MDFSVARNLLSLSMVEAIIMSLIVAFILYSYLTNRVHYIVFFIVLCASFVGTTIPVIENIASFVRWISIVFLLFTSFKKEKPKISPGFCIFWGYVVFGSIFLFRAINFDWQIQRAILLLVVVFTFTVAFSNSKFETVKSSLNAICIAGVVYCTVNFIVLPEHVSEGSRFLGYSSGASAFSLVLCGFLPFMLWNALNENALFIKVICSCGFVFCLIILVLSGQRTGTIAGVLSIVPLIFLKFGSKKGILLFLIAGLIFALFGSIIILENEDKIDFLSKRYNLNAGLSGRLDIWEKSLYEINKNPFLGSGIGAAENVIEDSFHNAYLEIWFNSGIVGLFFFLSAQGYFLVKIMFVQRRLQCKENKSIFKLALGYMIGFFLINFSESAGAGATNINLILFLFLASVISNNNVAHQKNRTIS